MMQCQKNAESFGNDNNDIGSPTKRNWVAFPGAREQAQHCRDGEAWYMGKEVRRVDLMNSVKGVRRHGGVYHTGWRHFTQGVEKRERAMRGANSSHTKEPTQVAGGNCLIIGRPRSENSATTTSSRTPPSSPR